jgi:hypothetical protein
VPRGLGVLELQAPGRGVDERRLVPQRLQQAQDAVAVLGRAQQHRHDQALAQVLGEIGEHLVARGLHVGEQLLHQLVVVVGELLEHLEARLVSRSFTLDGISTTSACACGR